MGVDIMRELTLREMFEAHDGRQIDKWEHYFPIYEKHFARFRGKSPRVLELGVDHGGSLQLWKRYFGSGASIIGVDIDDYRTYAEQQISVLKHDQKDPLIASYGPFDVIIDDGSHDRNDQEVSFANLWPRCQGVYFIEDCHNGYPLIAPTPPIHYAYPWVIVYERPKRSIVGKPSRELRPDEEEAIQLFGR
jgi:hypothetical protein